MVFLRAHGAPQKGRLLWLEVVLNFVQPLLSLKKLKIGNGSSKPNALSMIWSRISIVYWSMKAQNTGLIFARCTMRMPLRDLNNLITVRHERKYKKRPKRLATLK